MIIAVVVRGRVMKGKWSGVSSYGYGRHGGCSVVDDACGTVHGPIETVGILYNSIFPQNF